MEIEYYGEVDEEVKAEIEEHIENEFGGSEFKVMTEEGRDDEIRNYIRESLWAFKAEFIIGHTNIEDKHNARLIKAFEKMQAELCEDANELVFALIQDFDDLVEDAVGQDGYGHFLSPYDGNESEIFIQDKMYLVYRQN